MAKPNLYGMQRIDQAIVFVRERWMFWNQARRLAFDPSRMESGHAYTDNCTDVVDEVRHVAFGIVLSLANWRCNDAGRLQPAV